MLCPTNSYEIVMALVRAGAKLDVKDYSGSYPLHLAIVLGWSDLVDEIILTQDFTSSRQMVVVEHLACLQRNWVR